MSDVEQNDVSRRDSMKWLAGLCAMGACAACVNESFAQDKAPPRGPASGPVRIEIGKADKFAEERMYDEFRPRGFMISHTDGYLFAISTRCTHKGATVRIHPKDKTLLRCPSHGAEFSETGSVIKGQAKTSLLHLGISLRDDGMIVVDTSKTFTDSQWENDGAFLELKKPQK